MERPSDGTLQHHPVEADDDAAITLVNESIRPFGGQRSAAQRHATLQNRRFCRGNGGDDIRVGRVVGVAHDRRQVERRDNQHVDARYRDDLNDVLHGFRALGQYEFALLGEREPRLLFVGPNVGAAAASLGGEPAETLSWVALHEVTHAVQMASAPWVRSHLGDRARILLDGAAFRISATEIAARARAAMASDPRRTLAELRSSDPLRLIAPGSLRPAIDEVQATMSLVEGYAEHVMDAAAGDLAPNVARLRRGMDARREGRGAPIRLLLWLLGLEAKLRQYREGKAFADSVAERVGIDGLNRAWDGPAALPDRRELADPEAWIARAEPSVNPLTEPFRNR